MKSTGEKATCQSESGNLKRTTVESFRNHVATDGSLLGVSGKCACGWSVVQMDHDAEMGPMRGVCGTFDAELEVQRTIQRAELTIFQCLFPMIDGKGPKWLGKHFNHKMNQGRKTHGEDDMVRRVDPNGEALVWCKEGSGQPRCPLGQEKIHNDDDARHTSSHLCLRCTPSFQSLTKDGQLNETRGVTRKVCNRLF